MSRDAVPREGLHPFRLEDFSELQRWFEDAALDRALGPLDADWLASVLEEDPPAEFVLWRDGEAVASIGIARPLNEDDPFVVTSLAVRPDLRRSGVGRAILEAVRVREGARAWIAYVLPENPAAQRFFQRLGWSTTGTPEDGMLRF